MPVSLSDRHSDRTQSDATETPLNCTELSNNKVEVRAKIGPIPAIVEGRCNANLAARSSDSAAKTATVDEAYVWAPEIPKGVKNLRIRKDTAKCVSIRSPSITTPQCSVAASGASSSVLDRYLTRRAGCCITGTFEI